MNVENTGYISESGEVKFQSPSNIAIVKYWGKTDIQIPVNPSISFSLKNSFTETAIQYRYNKNQNEYAYHFLFEGKRNIIFEEKIAVFFDRVIEIFPWLKKYHLQIDSFNTFPHSSGIASSASSYSALSLALAKIHLLITGNKLSSNQISNCARLGSGSACRSVYGGWNSWGDTPELSFSSNKHAIQINTQIHPVFQSIQDTILIVSNEKKSVSSTVGHKLMENHPYKQGRIHQANSHTANLLKALKTGDLKSFIEISESEALSLHGLMMSSTPGYTLLLPQSLQIVQQIREFREQNNIPICFTIDAGPNIHVLYPEANKKRVQEFIQSELLKHCAGNHCIEDEIGFGPNEMN